MVSLVSNPHTMIFMRPRLDDNSISADTYLLLEFDLSVKAYHRGEIVSISQISISDTRYLQTLLEEIALIPTSEKPKNSKLNDHRIASARDYIEQVINNLRNNSESDNELHHCPEVFRLQFISCQLQNSRTPKNTAAL